MKPAQQLRAIIWRTPSAAQAVVNQSSELLDECERVLLRADVFMRVLPPEYDEPGSVLAEVQAVLAKLRGEA